MSNLTSPFRRATIEDAATTAELVNIACDDMALHVWKHLAQPGQSPWDVGIERVRLGVVSVACHNTVIREADGRVAACLIGYPSRDAATSGPPQPSNAELQTLVAPLIELGNLVTCNWYLNVLATFPQFRGRGFASELLRIADRLANEADCARISLTMSDANTAARRLYERHGYTERARRPIDKGSWNHAGHDWVLMVKEL
ncbi:MAG: GNAT family N-acetyltransferase [Phycisphaerales bacterium]|nr:GNAT family N-acetyltransferase [Phycisphaerales bacterium]MCB9855227.1 GNAT family N-acetyltransferase [Phycisphaerales bacterium]MCB9862820.1 GNAT family N-acetyltransferase [Phycisphaerales bacterium]